MFYCDGCREQESWPPTLDVKSHGACEVCGNVTTCNSVSSELLGDPQAYRLVEDRLRLLGGGPALDAMRDDAPAEEVELLMTAFLQMRTS